jgi:hypothetical protein
VHCKHCGIRFFTHPRNVDRKDLRCPFGCREHHRRELGRERSRRHYQKPEAKKKKELRNAQRSFPVGFDDANFSADGNPSPSVNASPGVDPSPDVDVAPHIDVARDVSFDHSCRATTEGLPEMGDEGAIPAATLSTVASAERHEPQDPGSETRAEGDRSSPEVACPVLPATKRCLIDSQHDPVNFECPDTVRDQMPLTGLVLDEASVVNSPILPYVRMVVSLIVGKSIGKDQLVQELLQIMRQRSIDNPTGPRYVSPFLDQHPP